MVHLLLMIAEHQNTWRKIKETSSMSRQQVLIHKDTLRIFVSRCICWLNDSENHGLEALTSIKRNTACYQFKKHWYSGLLQGL